MKKTILSCAFAALTIGAFAQIDVARGMPIGTSVTISGVVTNGDELGGIRYIQDATAGLPAYPGTGSVPFDPVRGDSISVTGLLKNYNGLLEIDPITNYTLHGSGYADPATTVVTPAQLGEATEGSLIQVNAATFVNGGSTFTSATWDFTSNGETGTLYLSSGHPLIGSTIPSGPINLIAISSQFTFITPPTDGYQVLPRDANDLILTSAINVTSLMTQSNITTTSFDLDWATDNDGSTNLNYGLTPVLGTLITNANSSSSHTVILTSLDPATIYYAQGFSVLGSDTAFTTIQAFCTESNSTGDIQVYFNNSVDNSVSSGVDAIELPGTVNDTVKAYFDRAQFTIDVAVYNASDATIMQALNDALGRGVQIRYITEGANANTGLSDLDASIPILERQNSMSSGMHNKFIIIDAELEDESIVISGSTNWTFNNLFQDFNNMVIIQDQSLARAYEVEFEEMWGSNGAQPNSGNSKFGPDKSNNTPHEFLINGDRVELYFSPSDGTTSAIGTSIGSTNEEMNFALLVLTNNDLSAAIIAANNTFGVGVNGIIEQENTSGSDFQDLLNAGVNVHSHQGVQHQLHHKYAIIDEGTTSDPMVITGSHNWSASAENENDENTLFIHSDEVANQFYQEFVRRMDEVTGIAEFSADPFEMSVYPNPGADHISLQFDNPSNEEVALSIIDLSGRVIQFSELRGFRGVNRVELNSSDLANGMYQMILRIGEVRDQEMFMIGQ